MAFANWRWEGTRKIWFIQCDIMSPPTCYCLGERYIYSEAGNHITWRGSTVDNWGGWHFGTDLKKAIEWVQGAENPGLGHSKWCIAGGKH